MKLPKLLPIVAIMCVPNLGTAHQLSFQGKQLKFEADSLPIRGKYVVIDDWVREYLAADWDKHAGDPYQKERAFCLRWQYDRVWGEVAYRVTYVEPARVREATPYGISFDCAKGKDRATMHVHGNSTCLTDDVCILNGNDAFECFPSPQDRAVLDSNGEPFHLIQCSREALIFFFPSEHP